MGICSLLTQVSFMSRPKCCRKVGYAPFTNYFKPRGIPSSELKDVILSLDEFEAGELSFDGGKEFQPETWNLELAYTATDRLEVAVKYEGGDDLSDFLPEDQYGVAVTYGLFENTSLALEYLHGEFKNDDERDLVTTQLAVEF